MLKGEKERQQISVSRNVNEILSRNVITADVGAVLQITGFDVLTPCHIHWAKKFISFIYPCWCDQIIVRGKQTLHDKSCHTVSCGGDAEGSVCTGHNFLDSFSCRVENVREDQCWTTATNTWHTSTMTHAQYTRCSSEGSEYRVSVVFISVKRESPWRCGITVFPMNVDKCELYSRR